MNIITASRELADKWMNDDRETVIGFFTRVDRHVVNGTRASLAVETYRMIEAIKPGEGNRFAAKLLKSVEEGK